MPFPVGLYYHTIRHLKLKQLVRRALLYLPRYVPLKPVPPRRLPLAPWVDGPERQKRLIGPECCQFLNEEHLVREPAAWHDDTVPKLWLYNLHYFDDLNAESSSRRIEWHRNLLERWIRDNPPPTGVGWEPYPLSRRIPNWVKWDLRTGLLSTAVKENMAVQLRHLRKGLEWHLLGNHLLANAKALIFGGLYFSGEEAKGWLLKGVSLLKEQLAEQILQDGGHFERSPMYHALILEDLLDIINLLQVYGHYPGSDSGAWSHLGDLVSQNILKMRGWINAMSHPDGEIGFFNDAAMKEAPTPAELDRYAVRLGLTATGVKVGSTHTAVQGRGQAHFLDHSGYARLEAGPAVVLVDIAPVGPDYQPGHAHADTLSCEVSLDGHRLLVNSGTSTYEVGPLRLRQRGTPAHNTVVVDGQNSSEIWSSFRVARRARVLEARCGVADSCLFATGAHNGYGRLRSGLVHKRTWWLSESDLRVVDEVMGNDEREIGVYFHFHPMWSIQPTDGKKFCLLRDGGSKPACIRVDDSLTWSIESDRYYPEFGKDCANLVLAGRCKERLPLQIVTRLTWDGAF